MKAKEKPAPIVGSFWYEHGKGGDRRRIIRIRSISPEGGETFVEAAVVSRRGAKDAYRASMRLRSLHTHYKPVELIVFAEHAKAAGFGYRQDDYWSDILRAEDAVASSERFVATDHGERFIRREVSERLISETKPPELPFIVRDNKSTGTNTVRLGGGDGLLDGLTVRKLPNGTERLANSNPVYNLTDYTTNLLGVEIARELATTQNLSARLAEQFAEPLAKIGVRIAETVYVQIVERFESTDFFTNKLAARIVKLLDTDTITTEAADIALAKLKAPKLADADNFAGLLEAQRNRRKGYGIPELDNEKTEPVDELLATRNGRVGGVE